MRKNKIDIFKKCKFVFNNAPKGDCYKWPESADVLIRLWPNVTPLQVSLFCHSRSDEESLEMELGAKQVNGKWQPAGDREKGCDPKKFSQTVLCEFISNMHFIPEQHMRAVSLSGINWQGVGILTDETTGEERWRKRELRYCLSC